MCAIDLESSNETGTVHDDCEGNAKCEEKEKCEPCTHYQLTASASCKSKKNTDNLSAIRQHKASNTIGSRAELAKLQKLTCKLTLDS